MKPIPCGVPSFLAVAALAGSVVLASATTIGACSNDGAGQLGHGGSGGAVNLAGASGSAGASQTAGAGGSAGGAGVTGQAGATGATGGGGADGGAGATASAGGNTGATDAANTAGGALVKGPFTCSTYIGAALTAEWWGQGFENIVDNTKWQLKWHHHGFVEAWGDPASPFWGDTGDPNNPNSGSPIISACTQNSTSPDRVVFLAMDWVLLTEQDWIDWLEKDLTAIKAKYPSVKWIDIMPTVRCPDNKMCNPNAKPGPGANDGAGPEDCYIPPFEDAAIAKVVAAHADSVGTGPIVMATMCNGGYGGHLTAADNKLAATAIGNFYKAVP